MPDLDPEFDESDLDPDLGESDLAPGLVEDVILDVDEVYELFDGRLAYLPSLLEGLTLTAG